MNTNTITINGQTITYTRDDRTTLANDYGKPIQPRTMYRPETDRALFARAYRISSRAYTSAMMRRTPDAQAFAQRSYVADTIGRAIIPTADHWLTFWSADLYVAAARYARRTPVEDTGAEDREDTINRIITRLAQWAIRQAAAHRLHGYTAQSALYECHKANTHNPCRAQRRATTQAIGTADPCNDKRREQFADDAGLDRTNAERQARFRAKRKLVRRE